MVYVIKKKKIASWFFLQFHALAALFLLPKAKFYI